MATRGLGYFALYGYSENLKYPLLRKCQADFQIILQKHSLGDTLQDSFKPWWLVKNMATRGQGVWRFDLCLMAVERYWPSWASCLFKPTVFQLTKVLFKHFVKKFFKKRFYFAVLFRVLAYLPLKLSPAISDDVTLEGWWLSALYHLLI